MAQFTDSNRSEHLFLQKYNKLQKLCAEKMNWQILLPLVDADQHHFYGIRIPATNEQREFDELILSLTKILIDSLNEKKLNNFIASDMKGDIKCSIYQLEIALSSVASEDYKKHIIFLRYLS